MDKQHDATIVPIFGDLHAGSTVAMMPPDSWIDQDGIEYRRNKVQALMWSHWLRSWEQVSATAGKYKNPRFVVIANGDMVEGNHHDSRQLVTRSLTGQVYIAESIIKEALSIIGFDHGRDKGYVLEGTEAHAGKAHEQEDELARRLEFEPRMKGRYVHGHLKLTIDGVNVDIAHHGGSVGGRAWTREGGLLGVAKNIYWQAVENGEKIPDYVIRSHLHRFTQAQYIGKKKTVNSMVLPAWQYKTHFANRVVVDSDASIGMVWLEIANGNCKLHTNVMEYDMEGYKKI